MANMSTNDVLNEVLASNIFDVFSKSFTISRPAKYIGSFMVTGKGHHDRAEIVRQKLEAARSYTRSKSILLLISLNGIKVCRDSDQHVYMAHALRRISFATCDPDHVQFAFLAREPKSEPNIQYCHAFVTCSSVEAEELNNIVGEAFRIAYAQQQLALSANQQLHSSVTAESTVEVNESQSETSSSLCQQSPGKTSTSTIPTTVTSLSDNAASNDRLVSPAMSNNATNMGSQSPPPSAVLKKPLPPIPKLCSHVPKTMDSRQSSARQHRSHEHHIHKHRSKEKTGAVCDTSDSTPNDACSIDSGRHTGTNESLDSSSICLSVDVERRRSQPPAPPPRGPSSLAPIGGQRNVLNNLPTLQVSTTAQELPATSPSDSRPISACLHSPSDDLLDGHIARPSSVVSHPESQHSYHVADVRICAGPTSSPTRRCDHHPNINNYSTTESGSQTKYSNKAIGRPRNEGDSHLSTTHPSLSSRSDSTQSTGSRHLTRYPDGGLMWDDNSDLTEAPWYQPHVPREVALDLLSTQDPGSFVVRDSGSHANCYALSVRFGEAPGRCLQKSPKSNRSGSSITPYHPYPMPGISHFLIQRTERGGVRLKGLDKEWPSLSCLVLHLTVMSEMLPCPLRLPKLAANPAFSPIDPSSVERDKCSASSCNHSDRFKSSNFNPISGSAPDSRVSNPAAFEDEDYQRLSDFSSILADLNMGAAG